MARGYQAKEEIRFDAIEWPNADLIDDEQRRAQIPFPLQATRRNRRIGRERVQEIVEHDVHHREAVLDRLDAQTARQVTLADPRRPEKENVLALTHDAARHQRIELAAIRLRLKRPVEVFECLATGQPRESQHRGDAALILALELARQQPAKKRPRIQPLARGGREQLGQRVGRVLEAERRELLRERIEGESGSGRHRRASSMSAA
ncbi:MAG: hypothetical protein MUE41_12965 [Gemmatimonadaceae bacterium]|nr:hypothetical protein [Gemmatimonadaceae bacterium]